MTPHHAPDLLRIYLRHCVTGFLLAAIFVVLVIGYDIGRIGSLMAGSGLAALWALGLWIALGLVFGAIQWALVQGRDEDDDDHQGGRMIPIRVPVRAKRRR